MPTRDIRLDADPDYINSPKHKNSLSVFMELHPDGTSDETICKVLCIDKAILELTYQKILAKMRAVFF
jgi:hypothetical protein